MKRIKGRKEGRSVIEKSKEEKYKQEKNDERGEGRNNIITEGRKA